MSSDYSSYSTDKLELMYKYAETAYRLLDCPGDARCEDCCISDDCKALARVKTHIHLEIFERESKGVSHGEEKENRP